jgi:hypothetical protein
MGWRTQEEYEAANASDERAALRALPLGERTVFRLRQALPLLALAALGLAIFLFS